MAVTRDHHAGNGHCRIKPSGRAGGLQDEEWATRDKIPESPCGANREGRNPQFKEDINLQEILNHLSTEPHSSTQVVPTVEWALNLDTCSSCSFLCKGGELIT